MITLIVRLVLGGKRVTKETDHDTYTEAFMTMKSYAGFGNLSGFTMEYEQGYQEYYDRLGQYLFSVEACHG
jgi:hypothetical protein